MSDVFHKWWSDHEFQTQKERHNHFKSLTKNEQLVLKRSFLEDGWCQLFCQNNIDRILDRIKCVYSIDLIDLRIKIIKHKRTFVIDRQTWDSIQKMILEYEPLYNSNLIFGGMTSKIWGKHNQFVVLNASHT